MIAHLLEKCKGQTKKYKKNISYFLWRYYGGKRGGEEMPGMILRTLVLYIAVVLSLRLMGKRQVGELEPSELAVTFLVSETATIPLQNPEMPLWHGLVLATRPPFASGSKIGERTSCTVYYSFPPKSKT